MGNVQTQLHRTNNSVSEKNLSVIRVQDTAVVCCHVGTLQGGSYISVYKHSSAWNQISNEANCLSWQIIFNTYI